MERSIAHFAVLGVMRVGSIGILYKARDTRLGRNVALKPVPGLESPDEKAGSNLLSRAAVAASLSHPNLLSVLAVEECDGRDFIVMEPVEGRTLGELISGTRFRPQEALGIAIQIAEGLKAAHDQVRAHGELTPDCILLTAKGHVKISWVVEEAAGPGGQSPGTPFAAPPAPGEPGDLSPHDHCRGGDIRALGLMLFEMITGGAAAAGLGEGARQPRERGGGDDDWESIGRYPCLESVIEKAASARDRCTGVAELLDDLRSCQREIASDTGVAKAGHADPETPQEGGLTAAVLVTALAVITAVAMLFGAHLNRTTADRAAPEPLGDQVDYVVEVASVAVLPFRDMSPARDMDYFCEGIADEIIHTLVGIRGLRVAALTSAFRFRDGEQDVRIVGRELNVGTVLEGSIRKDDERLRITAQLINASDGMHIWSEVYERRAEEIFAVQAEIARAIAAALSTTLTDGESQPVVNSYTGSPDVLDLYLKGRYHLNKNLPGDIARSIEYFQRAVAIDPHFAPAYAALAEAYITIDNIPPAQAFAAAREAAEKALALDENLAMAHVALGNIQQFEDWDWRAAGESFSRAIELNPGDAEVLRHCADFELMLGHFEQGISLARRAHDIDPLSPLSGHNLAQAYFFARQYDAGIEECLVAIDLNPDYRRNQWLLGHLYRKKGMDREAAAAYERAFITSGYDIDIINKIREFPAYSGWRAYIDYWIQRLTNSQGATYLSPYVIALFHARMGNSDQALERLWQAFRERDPSLPWIWVNPDFDSLRFDERFISLLRKLGIDNSR